MALLAVPGAIGERIARRLKDALWHAPQHLPIEVDAALRGLVLGGRLTDAQARTVRHSVGDLPVDLWPWELIGDRAWELRANLTTYDAGYVALAERLDAVLVTGDARIGAAPGVRCAVEIFR